MEVNVKEARSQLSALLDKVEQGEEVIVKRRGKKVAKLIRPEVNHPLPSLKDFRESIEIAGKSMSQTVIEARDEERY